MVSHDHNEGKLLEIIDAQEAELTRMTIENEDLKREIKKNQAAASDKEERGESARTYLEQHERSENARLREALDAIKALMPDMPDDAEYADAYDKAWTIARNALKETE